MFGHREEKGLANKKLSSPHKARGVKLIRRIPYQAPPVQCAKLKSNENNQNLIPTWRRFYMRTNV